MPLCDLAWGLPLTHCMSYAKCSSSLSLFSCPFNRGTQTGPFRIFFKKYNPYAKFSRHILLNTPQTSVTWVLSFSLYRWEKCDSERQTDLLGVKWLVHEETGIQIYVSLVTETALVSTHHSTLRRPEFRLELHFFFPVVGKSEVRNLTSRLS